MLRGKSVDHRPVDVRAESVVREAEFEADGEKLNRCDCGTAEIEEIPGQSVGFRCAGCKENLW